MNGSDGEVIITPEDVKRMLPKAVDWVTRMEQACANIGQPLLPQNKQDAEMIGIRDLAAIRVMVLREMPVPEDVELRQFAEQKLITPITKGMTFGHGIVLKQDQYDRHLIAHELVHVLQYERFGGIEPFLVAYIPEVVFSPFYPYGPLELEAERVADTICLSGP